MNPNSDMNDFITALGALAEIGLTFYRALLSSGATDSEAFTIAQAYLGSFNNPTKEGEL